MPSQTELILYGICPLLEGLSSYNLQTQEMQATLN